MNQSADRRQKYSASMTARTERSLAEKVGHLEMLGDGKKSGSSTAGKDSRKKKLGG